MTEYEDDVVPVRKRISFGEYLRLTIGLQVARGKRNSKKVERNGD